MSEHLLWRPESQKSFVHAFSIFLIDQNNNSGDQNGLIHTMVSSSVLGFNTKDF